MNSSRQLRKHKIAEDVEYELVNFEIDESQFEDSRPVAAAPTGMDSEAESEIDVVRYIQTGGRQNIPIPQVQFIGDNTYINPDFRLAVGYRRYINARPNVPRYDTDETDTRFLNSLSPQMKKHLLYCPSTQDSVFEWIMFNLETRFCFRNSSLPKPESAWRYISSLMRGDRAKLYLFPFVGSETPNYLTKTLFESVFEHWCRRRRTYKGGRQEGDPLLIYLRPPPDKKDKSFKKAFRPVGESPKRPSYEKVRLIYERLVLAEEIVRKILCHEKKHVSILIKMDQLICARTGLKPILYPQAQISNLSQYLADYETPMGYRRAPFREGTAVDDFKDEEESPLSFQAMYKASVSNNRGFGRRGRGGKLWIYRPPRRVSVEKSI